MLSKCSNPECSETFRYLHAGKIFYLAPTPDLQLAKGMLRPALHERFWLCAQCAKEMTLIWGGAEVQLVRLPAKVAVPAPPVLQSAVAGRRQRARAASAGREDN